jgi:hypothetical protein
MYKKLFYDYFDICETDIVYQLETFNLCLFPKPISSLHVNSNIDLWKEQVDYLFNILNGEVNGYEKDISLLMMPRQRKENYKNNDRCYDTLDLENFIQKSGVLLHTDEILVLREQIAPLHRSKNVILTGGSPYFVNGLFCQDTNLVVLDDFMVPQIKAFIKLRYIHDKIGEKNKVYMVQNKNNTFCYDDIQAYLA